MSHGTGFDPILDTLLNVATNVSTAGLVGYGKNGFQADQGVIGKPAIGAVKEVTGAKAAEEANQIAQDQFQQSVNQEEKKRADTISQSANRQLQLSNSTTKTNTSTMATKNTSSGNTDVSNFLGL